MKTDEVIQRVKSELPGAFLQVQSMRPSGEAVVWIEARSIGEVAGLLKREFSLDWIENISAMELDGALVLTYFVSSTDAGASRILRVSVEMKSGADAVEVPSITRAWPMGAFQESEIADLFGVVFKGSAHRAKIFLPTGFKGYPLRKSYALPRGGS